jgi:hypothetical protein
MNHYCTYFDRGFLAQGLALWRSLARHDPAAVLWVLALDDETAAMLAELDEGNLRVVRLADVEQGDAALAAAKSNRSRVEYVFTLSPCWPRWLLAAHPAIERVTYLDADMFFFGDPRGIFAAMDAAQASVLVTAHRFPRWLMRYERHGKFNVGILSFRNDAAGRACLDDWREQCLAWCYDSLEEERYADQKYLDAWPAKLGAKLLVLDRPGVNLAPWNWANEDFVQRRWVDDGELVLFHFARFRPLRGDWWWHSGQLEYGVMPGALRRAIYAPYARALLAARDEIRARRPEFDFVRRPARTGREFWQNLPLRLVFGGDWLRLGDSFLNLRLGLGRWSGPALAQLRRLSPNR